MDFGVGLGFASRPVLGLAPTIVNTHSFLSSVAVPTGYTFTRASAGTYRDENGDWQSAATNTIRPFYDTDSTLLGGLMEGTRINKCQTPNYNFADVTDWASAITGGTGTISLEDKETEIDASGLGDICTNHMAIKIENTTASLLQVVVPGTVGNTNPHSIQVFVAYSDTGYHGTFKLEGGATQTLMQDTNGSTYQNFHHLKFQNVTPTSSARRMNFNIAGNKTIWIVLFDMQEGTFCSTPILNSTSGQVTRSRDILYDASLDTREYFSPTAGSVIIKAKPYADEIYATEQYIFNIGAGTGTEELFQLRYLTRAKGQGLVTAGNSPQISTGDINAGPITDHSEIYFATWKNGYAKLGTGGAYKDGSSITLPSGLDRIDIGGRPFSQDFFGYIESITIVNKFLTQEQVGAYGYASGSKALIAAGQSNMEGYFSQQQDKTNTGHRALVAEVDNYWTDVDTYVLNGATAGSAALLENDNGVNGWWYDPDTETFGEVYYRWEQAAKAFIAGGGTVEGVLWSQGSSDLGTADAELKAAWLAIFTKMRTIIGDKPIIIQPMGRRTDFASALYNNLRATQQELAAEQSFIHLSPEIAHQTLSADGVHYLSTSYAAQAPLFVRKAMSVIGETVSGGVDGPTIASAVLAGDTVTVTLSHDTGATDFTPTTGIQGFRFYDGANSEVTILSAERTSATVITVTLASSQTDGTLYYIHGTGSHITDNAQMVRDNSTYNNPLRHFVGAV